MSSASPSPEPAETKRKRPVVPEEEEIEIDVNLPEPASKKAKRAEKKKKEKKPSKSTSTTSSRPEAKNDDDLTEANTTPSTNLVAQNGRSEYGIWIGNLPYSATKDSLGEFFKNEGKIDRDEIVRLHMPTPIDRRDQAKNKGFAYVDFTTEEALAKAMGLSEYMLSGRRVLIKNAKSFEGRPVKTAAANTEATAGAEAVGAKEPARRIFVGNLGFDVTKEDLSEHFGQAGEVEDIHMATFEDSGKCKGYAWIRFTEPEGAEAAVRGFVYVKTEDVGSDDDDEEEDVEAEGDSGNEDGAEKKRKVKKAKKSGSKRHKQHLNRLHGRELRCEIAEDAQTRYKKRYGKKEDAEGGDRRARPTRSFDAEVADGGRPQQRQQRGDKDFRQDERRKRHEAKRRVDARNIAPGKALSEAPRATGAIVEARGTKKTFD
ncbi:hypothetical protein LTR62_000731 [Meristemomyces frigidus]|uniref:RRM domain-containing protein n=1 Tax=Meristemomyces frigidus TaxID=1508187 RepID=A0AAN7YLD6_9PEZI|nr:hypothetical protein LTR62_000731 [Meristemomyces frigidus]